MPERHLSAMGHLRHDRLAEARRRGGVVGRTERGGTGCPDSHAGRLSAFGTPPDLASAIAAGSSQTMSSCILDLYRSAMPNPNADWGTELPRAGEVPGLIVIPSRDPFNDDALSSDVAKLTGAQVVRLDGLSHNWMAQDPRSAAEALRRFWSQVH